MTDLDIGIGHPVTLEDLRFQAFLLSRVLPNLSVQMRTALSGMYLAVEAMIPEEARDFDRGLDQHKAVMDLNYYRLLRLTGNLSAAAELQRPGAEPQEDRDIAAEAALVCQEAESLARLLGLTLRFRCKESRHLCALRPDAVRELLMQLLSNAFKFTPAGGEVTISLEFSGGWALLQVADTGRGIPEERRQELFDRYYMTEQRDPPPYGLGLGLTICRRLAECHGGRMLAESQVGKGTRVTVMLPDRQTGRMALSDRPVDYNGGFNPVLLGLADALPAKAFQDL